MDEKKVKEKEELSQLYSKRAVQKTSSMVHSNPPKDQPADGRGVDTERATSVAEPGYPFLRKEMVKENPHNPLDIWKSLEIKLRE